MAKLPLLKTVELENIIGLLLQTILEWSSLQRVLKIKNNKSKMQIKNGKITSMKALMTRNNKGRLNKRKERSVLHKV